MQQQKHQQRERRRRRPAFTLKKRNCDPGIRIKAMSIGGSDNDAAKRTVAKNGKGTNGKRGRVGIFFNLGAATVHLFPILSPHIYASQIYYDEQQRHRLQPHPSHDDKKGLKLRHLLSKRNCHEIYNGPRPLYTEDDWERLRRLYRDLGGTTVAYDGEIESRAEEGFIPPTIAKQTANGRGRGLFATRDVRRGEMTYGGKQNFAFFPTGVSLRRFLDELEDDGMACDVMHWVWPQEDMGEDYEPIIALVLDNNTYMNDGGAEGANTGCPEELEPCGMFDEYALRDIKAGEEILCDYSDFYDSGFGDTFDDQLWEHFGL